jgi:pimeloyl-ACP methyl ester carboxylesterase
MRSPARPRSRSRLVLLLFAVGAGLGLGLAIDVIRSGGPTGWLARHHLAPPYEARGTRVDIGRQSLYIDCRGEGTPTVVLEAGSGADSSTWSAVIDDLASTTRTCAYDRAGRARSDPAQPRTLSQATADLRALLAAAGERPPFVLAGHSLGGAFARVFAAENRDEVVGLVLVDTFDPDLQVDRIHPWLGELRAEYEATLDRLRATVARVDSLEWPASETELRDSTRATAGLPIEVLVAPRREPRLGDAENATIAAAWLDAYDSLSPDRVRVVTAWGAGHDVQIDRPDLVIESVRRLVDLARQP